MKTPETPYAIFVENRAIIAEVTHEGCSLKFLVANRNDLIQKIHLQGSLYETEELSIIKKYYVPGTTFADIGSNVGNHAIWAASCLRAPRVIGFEPVLGQHTLFCANVALNGLGDIITVQKTALSSNSGKARIEGSFQISDNSGSSRLSSTGLGEEVRMSTGDVELADAGPLFIKIDVEGHEISVLEGLQKTIRQHRPILFVEVDSINEAAFDAWVQDNHYKKREKYQRYEQNCNYIVVPQEWTAQAA